MPVQLKELWVSRSSLTERTGAGTELVGVGVGVAVGVFVGVGMVTLTYSDQGLERPPLSSALTVYQYLVPGVRFECLSDVFVVSRFRSCHPDSPDFHQRVTCPPKAGPVSMLELGRRKGGDMARKKHTPEQVIKKLREAEVALAEGGTVAEAARRIGVTEQTFYRWRSEYGGLRLDQARRLKRLELENSRLKRAVADLTLDNQILREASEGNF